MIQDPILTVIKLEEETVAMNYRNAKEVFPENLLIEIMKYVGEGLIYFPANEEKKQWGSVSGTREQLQKRNMDIRCDYKDGMTISELEEKYYLSQSSLRRIIYSK